MSARPEVVLLFVFAAFIVLSPLLTLLIDRERNGARLVGNILLALSLTALSLVFLLFDSMEAASASSAFCAIFLILGAGPSVVIFRRYHSWVPVCLGAVFVAVILTAHFTDFSPVKSCRRFFAAIHEGMNEIEVMAILRREFPQGGHFPVPVLTSPSPGQMVFILDPKQGAYNAESVLLTLDDGRVTAKVYTPD